MPGRGDRQHRRALVEAGDSPRRWRVRNPVPQATSSVRTGGSAASVSDSDSRSLVPARPVALLEEAGSDPPVVVLLRPRLVVRLHAPRVRMCSNPCRTSRKAATRPSIGALRESLSAPARLLDVHTDPDHHRSVFTLVGEPDELVETLLAGVACRTRADRPAPARRRASAHRRRGRRSDRPDPQGRPERARDDRARRSRARIGTELGLPVFLYGELAPGRGPAFFRRGGPDGAPAADRRRRARARLRAGAARRARRAA